MLGKFEISLLGRQKLSSFNLSDRLINFGQTLRSEKVIKVFDFVG